MKKTELVRQRLVNQQLKRPSFTSAAEVVSSMCAIQAQDYAMAKWAIGCRAKGLTDADVEKAFNNGEILRTHLLRPTWHFVLPTDIKWLLNLTAPRIKALSKYQHKKLGLDDSVLKKSKKTIEKALDKEAKMTRPQLVGKLAEAGLDTNESRVVFYLMDAELDGLICSAGRIGKQFAYTLLDRQVPAPDTMSRDEALAELARRYFMSRGPASVHDFAWWSGMSLTDARKGAEMNRESLNHENIDDKEYLFGSQNYSRVKPDNIIYLLPGYDEMAVAYADRSAMMPDLPHGEASFGLKPIILAAEKVIGTWRPELKKGEIKVAPQLFGHSKISQAEVVAAGKKYVEFIKPKDSSFYAIFGAKHIFK